MHSVFHSVCVCVCVFVCVFVFENEDPNEQQNNQPDDCGHSTEGYKQFLHLTQQTPELSEA